MYAGLPSDRPATPHLDRIKSPATLRRLAQSSLPTIAEELRAFLLYTVGQTGGHFGAGLGVVELTVALHYVMDTPEDLLIWDVGHQSYPHKILTGRRSRMRTLRASDGIAPFPQRDESEFDAWGVGHSSTSVSAALGMLAADRLAGRNRHIAAVIGDGALTSGMAWEALSHAAQLKAPLLVVLNDNGLSISPNVGGIAAALRSNAGESLFRAMGLDYRGPIDGHDLDVLITALQAGIAAEGPTLLHVRTRKGAGYEPAERDPVASHSLAKLPPPEERAPGQNAPPSWSQVFGDWAVDVAGREPRMAAITPAMREGSGLVEFSRVWPERFFDVAIAEQHAVTFAAGMAAAGYKPVVAIYSTFLQRGYDQLIHDVAVQNLDVLFALDRAGLVEDGPTHSGVLDLAYLRCVPNLLVLAPADASEARRMLEFGLQHDGPVAVRYSRGAAPTQVEPRARLAPGAPAPADGMATLLRSGDRIAILSFGSMLTTGRAVAEQHEATLWDMRFIKPLDGAALEEVCSEHDGIVTLEEGVAAGGAGSAVAEWLSAHDQLRPILQIGIPDQFMSHGSVSDQKERAGLSEQQISSQIATWRAAHDL